MPEAFTSDPDRLARFEREAKVLASLNHTNIGSIYGLEEAEGVKALVLALVEGRRWQIASSRGRFPSTKPCPSPSRLPRPWKRPMSRALSTAT